MASSLTYIPMVFDTLTHLSLYKNQLAACHLPSLIPWNAHAGGEDRCLLRGAGRICSKGSKPKEAVSVRNASLCKVMKKLTLFKWIVLCFSHTKMSGSGQLWVSPLKSTRAGISDFLEPSFGVSRWQLYICFQNKGEATGNQLACSSGQENPFSKPQGRFPLTSHKTQLC